LFKKGKKMRKIMLMCAGLCCFGLSQAMQGAEERTVVSCIATGKQEFLQCIVGRKHILFEGVHISTSGLKQKVPVLLPVVDESLGGIIGLLEALKKKEDLHTLAMWYVLELASKKGAQGDQRTVLLAAGSTPDAVVSSISVQLGKGRERPDGSDVALIKYLPLGQLICFSATPYIEEEDNAEREP
jgi:hypothetical protein